MAKNHPFIDGNKRTAFLAAAAFLELNGYLIAPSEVEVVDKMAQVAAGKVDQAGFASWLKANVRRKRKKS